MDKIKNQNKHTNEVVKDKRKYLVTNVSSRSAGDVSFPYFKMMVRRLLHFNFPWLSSDRSSEKLATRADMGREILHWFGAYFATYSTEL